MIYITIALAAGFFIMMGFAARQMQDLRESDTKIALLRSDMDDLIRENVSLRRDKADHEANLEMVLTELNTSS